MIVPSVREINHIYPMPQPGYKVGKEFIFLFENAWCSNYPIGLNAVCKGNYQKAKIYRIFKDVFVLTQEY